MADNMNKKKSPSFPSNYVTMVELQERWLERKKREEEDRRQKQSQLEDEASVARRVVPESTRPSQLKPRRRDSPEASAPKVELAGDDVRVADRGENSKAKKKKKKKSKKKGKTDMQKELGSMAENEVAVIEPPLSNVENDGVGGDAACQIRGESGGSEPSPGLGADSRVSSSNRGIGKKRSGKWKSHERKTKGGETIAESKSDILYEKTELGTKSRVSSENAVIVQEDEGLLRRNYGGKKKKEPVSWNRGKGGERVKARAESNGLGRSVNVVSSVRALPLNGEIVEKNGGKGKKRSGEIEPELRSEISGLDQSVNVESQFRDLSVNGAIAKKNGRRNGRNERRSRETRAESDKVDQKTEIEPRLGEGNEELQRNVKKRGGSLRRSQESRKTRGDARSESSELDQSEHKDRALPVSGWVRKGRVVQVIRNEERRGGKVETTTERTNLDHRTVIEPEFRAFSVNVETKEGSGVEEESQGTGVETMAESNNLNQTNHTKPHIRTVCEYGRTWKGNGRVSWRTKAGYDRSYSESWSSAYGRVSQREVLNGRDSGMVWMKKGEA